MALEGFESSIGGKWILLRNERFDDYLGAMGNITTTTIITIIII